MIKLLTCARSWFKRIDPSEFEDFSEDELEAYLSFQQLMSSKPTLKSPKPIQSDRESLLSKPSHN